MGGPQQGTEMDLLRSNVDSAATGNATDPATLQPFTPLNPAQARRTRVFTLAMSGMVHTINGELFNMQRRHFSVPFGDVEIWEYRNTGTEPHPMHAHAAFCQVLSRSSAASSGLERQETSARAAGISVSSRTTKGACFTPRFCSAWFDACSAV